MHVRVGLLGILGHYAGEQQIELDLPEGATVGTVIQEIGWRYGKRFPEEVWDRHDRSFAPGVSAFLNLQDVEDLDARLNDGSEVLFVTMIVGG